MIIDLEKRNAKFLKLFVDLGFDVRIIGKPDAPCMIYKDKFVLSCHMHKNNVVFTDKSHKGQTLCTISLEGEKPEVVYPKESIGSEITKAFIQGIIDSAEHRQCFRIIIENIENMFLSGWNTKQKNNGDTVMYPVFSRYNSRIYFHKEYADKICKDYPEYKLSII